MKNGDFWLENLLIRLWLQNHLTSKAEIWPQCGSLLMLYANRVWGLPVTRPKFYRPKMDNKLMNLNRYISVITNIDEKWFVIFEHTINHLSNGYVHLPQFECHFSFFFSVLFAFFVFLPMLSTSKPLNKMYSKFERLKISGRTGVRLKSGVPGWGIPLNRVLQSFEL